METVGGTSLLLSLSFIAYTVIHLAKLGSTNGDCHKALLRGTALQTKLPASSCNQMARVKMANKPAPIRQSYSTVSETMLSFMNHIKVCVTSFV